MPSKKPISIKESEYLRLFHPKDLIAKLEVGCWPIEIMAAWNISEKTFNRWLHTYPEFDDAYHIGLPKLQAYWVTNGWSKMIGSKTKIDSGKIKALEKLFDHQFKEYKQTNTPLGTTININSMQVLQEKSSSELIEKITQNIDFLSQNNVINAEYKLLTNDSESNE
jgi:hypothetical protein